jgi:hypothetical protein
MGSQRFETLASSTEQRSEVCSEKLKNDVFL